MGIWKINEIQFEELKYPPNFLPYRIKKIKGIIRHCETILFLNSSCQYLYLGCKACSNKKNRIMQKYFAKRRITLQIPWGKGEPMKPIILRDDTENLGEIKDREEPKVKKEIGEITERINKINKILDSQSKLFNQIGTLLKKIK
jgi:hypothetical protein